MGIFGKLFKGPEIDQAKSADSKQKMRRLFDSVVPDGGQYQLVAAYTEDAKRFNYGLVHGSKTTYGSLIVGWKEGADPTVVVVPTVPDLSLIHIYKGMAMLDYQRKYREYQNQTGPVRRGVGLAVFWYNTACLLYTSRPAAGQESHPPGAGSRPGREV